MGSLRRLVDSAERELELGGRPVILTMCPTCGRRLEVVYRPNGRERYCTGSHRDSLPRLHPLRPDGGRHAKAELIVLDVGDGTAEVPERFPTKRSLACIRGNHGSRCNRLKHGCSCDCHFPTLRELRFAIRRRTAKRPPLRL